MRVVCLALGLVLGTHAGAEALYRLPWPEGQSFPFTQVPGGRITTHFTKATAQAVDIAMPEGMPVVAAREGVVEAVETRHGASAEEEPLTYEGNFVRVRHADGTAAVYAHLKHRSAAVAAGERVAAGQSLGLSGASGDTDAPHLHFAVIRSVKNSAGWQEEVSLPIKFYVGQPAVPFSARAGLRPTAYYAGPAELPLFPSETSLTRWKPPAPQPGDELRAWAEIAILIACAVAGWVWFGWFAWFAKSPRD